MIAAILTAMSDFWPILAGGVIAVGSLLWSWLRTMRVQTREAQADQKVAEAEKRVAQNQASEAQANEAAARAGAEATQERTHVESDIAAGQPGESAQRLRDQWSRGD